MVFLVFVINSDNVNSVENGSIDIDIDYYCGDSVCETSMGEYCNTCAADCGACCGNTVCESNYSESCSNCATDCGSCPSTPGPGGGGGGGVTPPDTTVGIPRIVYRMFPFGVEEDYLDIYLKREERVAEFLEIQNNWNSNLEIIIREEGLANNVEIENNTLLINPELKEILKIIFKASENDKIGTKLGRIIIEGKGVSNVINVVLHIMPDLPLIRIAVNLGSSSYEPGDIVESYIQIAKDENYNGEFDNVELNFYYSIKNMNNELIVFAEEYRDLNTSESYTYGLELPDNAKPGDYIYEVKSLYQDKILAHDSRGFKILEIETPSKTYELLKPYLILLVKYGWILIIIAIVVVYLLYRRKKRERGGYLSDYVFSRKNRGESKKVAKEIKDEKNLNNLKPV